MEVSSLFSKPVPGLLILYKTDPAFGMCKNALANQTQSFQYIKDYSGFIVTSKSKELENTCGGRDSSKDQLENEPVRQIDPSPSFQNWSSFASLTRGLFSSRDFYLARNSAETFEQHMLGLIKQVNMTRSSELFLDSRLSTFTSDKKIDQSRYNVLTRHLDFASSGDPRKCRPELALPHILAEIQFLFNRRRDDSVSVTPIASVIRYVNGSGGCVAVSDVWCGKGLGFSTDAVSMDHPRRNLLPSRRKIDVDKNNSNQTEIKFRMPFLITGQAIDWYSE
ncbi:hypothetical protein YC2023_050075 [Brassica napus]